MMNASANSSASGGSEKYAERNTMGMPGRRRRISEATSPPFKSGM